MMTYERYTQVHTGHDTTLIKNFSNNIGPHIITCKLTKKLADTYAPINTDARTQTQLRIAPPLCDHDLPPLS